MSKIIIEKISKKDGTIIVCILFFPFFVLGFFVLRSTISSPSTLELVKRDDLMQHFNGKVDSLYFDRRNHNVKYAVSSTKDIFPIFRNWENSIAVGDSLSKNRNSYKLEIFKKNGTRIVLDYRDTYKKTK